MSIEQFSENHTQTAHTTKRDNSTSKLRLLTRITHTRLGSAAKRSINQFVNLKLFSLCVSCVCVVCVITNVNGFIGIPPNMMVTQVGKGKAQRTNIQMEFKFRHNQDVLSRHFQMKSIRSMRGCRFDHVLCWICLRFTTSPLITSYELGSMIYFAVFFIYQTRNNNNNSIL